MIQDILRYFIQCYYFSLISFTHDKYWIPGNGNLIFDTNAWYLILSIWYLKFDNWYLIFAIWHLLTICQELSPLAPVECLEILSENLLYLVEWSDITKNYLVQSIRSFRLELRHCRGVPIMLVVAISVNMFSSLLSNGPNTCAHHITPNIYCRLFLYYSVPRKPSTTNFYHGRHRNFLNFRCF